VPLNGRYLAVSVDDAPELTSAQEAVLQTALASDVRGAACPPQMRASALATLALDVAPPVPIAPQHD